MKWVASSKFLVSDINFSLAFYYSEQLMNSFCPFTNIDDNLLLNWLLLVELSSWVLQISTKDIFGLNQGLSWLLYLLIRDLTVICWNVVISVVCGVLLKWRVCLQTIIGWEIFNCKKTLAKRIWNYLFDYFDRFQTRLVHKRGIKLTAELICF